MCWLLLLFVQVQWVMHVSFVRSKPDWLLQEGVSWNAWQRFTGISLITPSHLLLPRKVVLLWGAGTADASTACSIGHFLSGRIKERRQTIV